MPFRKLPLGFGVFALCATASVAQKKAAAQAAQAEPAAKLQGIDDLVAQAMEEWKVPGLALGIVKDGKVIYAKGYGFRDVEAKRKKQEEESKKSKTSDKKTGTQPSHDLKDYAGNYENPGYGVIKIEQKGDAFELTLNKLGPYPLVHHHYDVFQIPEDADTLAAGELFQFHIDKKGDIHSVSAALEPALQEDIVFARAAEKISSDVLRTLTGEYVLNGMPVTVALAGDSLRLTVPGQPQYELAPTQGLTFDIKGMAGFSVEFKKDDTGKVTAAVFHQPNGVFTTTRK